MDLTPADLLACERELAARSLSDFIRLGWDQIDPEPYQHNWHMEAICEHLQACHAGEIRRLLINVPPGTSKSSATCVFFPAWLWGPGGMPEARFIGASHSQDNANRDNRRTRLLIESPWFQARWPTRLATDQNIKSNFENVAGGFRQASAVASMTGKRGHFVVWDDPQNPETANSDLERDTAIRVFSETLTSRLVNPRESVIIIIMQRLHEHDVSGHILESELGYEHLMLPMEFEPERRCVTSIGFNDPRSAPGELLFPERFPPEVVERDKKAMGSYAAAGQLQQRPAPRGGGMFKRADFRVLRARPRFKRAVRGWDLAATENRHGAYTAAVLMGETPEGAFVIADVKREQLSAGGVKALLRLTAAEDGRGVRGSLPRDPGAGGKAWAEDLVRAVAGFPYRATPETGDKATRAEPLAAQVEAGNVYLVEGDWTRAFLDEITTFPAGRYADQVDAASRAFLELTQGPAHAVSGTYG